jgi:hypothetical protein
MSQQGRKSGFSFHFSSDLRMSHLKACIHTLKNICLSLHILLSMILQLGGLLCLIGGIALAVAVAVGTKDTVDEEVKKGNLEFWFQ